MLRWGEGPVTLPAMFAKRRERLLSAMGPGALIVSAAPVAIRNNDVEHAYRQDSDFFYLTGFDEPESVLILTNQHPAHRTVLFVRPRNPEREIWDGPRAGVDGAVSDFGADAAFPIDELESRLPDYLEDVGRVHYRLGRDRVFDDRFFSALDVVRRRARRGASVPTDIVDPAATVHELRLVKGDDEVKAMSRAARVTCDAHLAAMRAARPGIHEFEVEAEMNRVFRRAGCERSAYDSILGSGRNATILHYRKNDRMMEDGDLLLIDAGCELAYYASDVTRTFPVNGKFSDAQRAIYELVLKSQEAAIALCVPGRTLDDLHEAATRVITAGLVELGLLEGEVDALIGEGAQKAYYMHRTSHWIGMDVHDVGAYFMDGAPRRLTPGHVLTVEPGIYIADNADCDPRWRGIGVRIEDDIVVTEGAPLNLTAEIPKSVEELETLVQGRL